MGQLWMHMERLQYVNLACCLFYASCMVSNITLANASDYCNALKASVHGEVHGVPDKETEAVMYHNLHLWWLPSATCAGGPFPSSTCAYTTCTYCSFHWVVVVVS